MTSLTASARTWRSRALTVLLLLFGTALLGYAVFYLSAPIAQADRAARRYQNIFLLTAGILGIAGWMLGLRQRRADASGALDWLAILLPCYAAFQLVPLPLSVLRVLSPERARLADGLAPLSLETGSAPLSIAPGLTLTHFLLFGAYAVVFLVIREIVRGNSGPPWLVVLPILAIASWQAVLGLTQAFGSEPDAFAHGSFPIKNHFAGFLEMSLPLAVAYGMAAVDRGRRRDLPVPSVVQAFVGFAWAGLIFSGILYSVSRMGVAAGIGSLSFMGALVVIARVRGVKRWSAVTLLCLAIVGVFVFEAPAQLIRRLAEISSDERVPAWRDTLHVIAAYPIFGCGLGGYQAAFEKYKSSEGTFTQDYAHNDYLQYLAELGLVGFAIAGTFLTMIVVRSIRSGLRHPEPNGPGPDGRWLGLGCAGALAAILIHSAADFNLYVPANAILLAWICGIAAGTTKSVETRD